MIFASMLALFLTLISVMLILKPLNDGTYQFEDCYDEPIDVTISSDVWKMPENNSHIRHIAEYHSVIACGEICSNTVII